MATEKIVHVKLFAPDGTPVEVNGEERAEILMGRGYTKSKPRNPAQPAGKQDDSDEVAKLKTDLAKAEKERDEALKAATEPAKTDKK